METTSFANTRCVPKLAIVFAAVSVLIFVATFVSMQLNPSGDVDAVQWVKAEDAIEKARKSRKPILYFFTANWCPPCKLIHKQVFMNRKLGKRISNQFVPVMVKMVGNDMKKQPKYVRDLNKEYEIEAFPTIVVVSNTVSGRKIQRGYDGKEKVQKFLQKSLQWAIQVDSGLLIDWQALDRLDSIKEDKPVIIVFFDESEDYSVFKYFSDKDLVTLINKEFYAVLIHKSEKKRAKAKTQECWTAVKELDTGEYPSLVVSISEKEAPHYLLDLSDQRKTFNFLNLILEYLPEKRNISKQNKD